MIIMSPGRSQLFTIYYRRGKSINDEFVYCSGGEDLHAYTWDRYYGVCLAKYQHTDVVNSVAFNPRDSEMLITTSDDYSIKVYSLY